MAHLIGQSIGRYRIFAQLGEGGMATVYRAFDTRLEREVAFKVILPSHHGAPKFLARFEREAKALARLSHPHIVKILDYGEHEGLPYLVMEYVPAGTLKARLGKPIPSPAAAGLLAPIARALEYAHGRKIIHRDVKPSNILFTEAGQPMLSDFGVAKVLEAEETWDLTGTGVGVGTPEYMAPEQAMGKSADHRVDIYALGIVFYELVTGRTPFQADTPLAVLLKHVNDPLPRPRDLVREIPTDVEQVIFKALAKQAKDRFQGMDAFAETLEKLARSGRSGIRGRARVPGQRLIRPLRLAGATGGLIAILAVLWLVGALPRLGARSSPSTVQPEGAALDSAAAESPTADITQAVAIIRQVTETSQAERNASATMASYQFSSPDVSDADLTPPENDNFADAIVMEELPFTISLNTSAATREDGEPQECPGYPYPSAAAFMQKTVWYRFTPETTMGLDLEGNTDLEIGVVVYTGSSLDSLTYAGCFVAGGQWQGTHPTMFFGGTTYYLQVGGPVGANMILTFRPHQ
jgi:serine/threonine protein kinase